MPGAYQRRPEPKGNGEDEDHCKDAEGPGADLLLGLGPRIASGPRAHERRAPASSAPRPRSPRSPGPGSASPSAPSSRFRLEPEVERLPGRPFPGLEPRRVVDGPSVPTAVVPEGPRPAQEMITRRPRNGDRRSAPLQPAGRTDDAADDLAVSTQPQPQPFRVLEGDPRQGLAGGPARDPSAERVRSQPAVPHRAGEPLSHETVQRLGARDEARRQRRDPAHGPGDPLPSADHRSWDRRRTSSPPPEPPPGPLGTDRKAGSARTDSLVVAERHGCGPPVPSVVPWLSAEPWITP